MCAISRLGYSYQASLLRDICKATSALLFSGSAVQIGWTPSHTGIAGEDVFANLAAEGTLPTVVLSSAHIDPWSAPPRVAGLA